MPHEWAYVGAGWGITVVVLGSYVTWLLRKTRRLGRALAGDADG